MLGQLTITGHVISMSIRWSNEGFVGALKLRIFWSVWSDLRRIRGWTTWPLLWVKLSIYIHDSKVISLSFLSSECDGYITKILKLRCRSKPSNEARRSSWFANIQIRRFVAGVCEIQNTIFLSRPLVVNPSIPIRRPEVRAKRVTRWWALPVRRELIAINLRSNKKMVATLERRFQKAKVFGHKYMWPWIFHFGAQWLAFYSYIVMCICPNWKAWRSGQPTMGAAFTKVRPRRGLLNRESRFDKSFTWEGNDRRIAATVSRMLVCRTVFRRTNKTVYGYDTKDSLLKQQCVVVCGPQIESMSRT